LLVVLVWLPAKFGAAQPESSASSEGGALVVPDGGTQLVHSIPLEKVPDRAVDTHAEVEALLPTEASRLDIEQIDSGLAGWLPEVDSRLVGARESLAKQPTLRTLQALESDLNESLWRMQPWAERLDNQLDSLSAALDRLGSLEEQWAETARLGREEGVSGTTLSRISSVRRELAAMRSTVLKRRDRVLVVRDKLTDPSIALTASLEQVRNALNARLEAVFIADRAPLWSAEVRESLSNELRRDGPAHLVRRLREGSVYATARLRIFGFQLALLFAIAMGFRSLRDRAEARAEDDYNLRSAKQVFELPWAIAVLIVVLTTTPLHPLAPRLGSVAVSALGAISTLWIGRRFLAAAMRPLAWGLVVVYWLDLVRDLLDATPTIGRVFFQFEMIGALGLLLWLLRPSRLSKIPLELQQTPFLRLLGTTMRVGAVALALAITADVVGFGDLASIVGSVTIRAGYTGFFIFVVTMICRSLATFALVLWPIRLLRSVSRHRLLVRLHLERILSLSGVVAWGVLTLGRLGLINPTRMFVGDLLSAGVSIGALKISLGNVTAFSITLWLSWLLARLVDFVLNEDVFTRVNVSRGVPYAISGLVWYTLMLVGFLIALSAAGVELSRLTVVAGGLGVGIGFGLQNVVGNFVSGLILLFERPIQVGDTVQLTDVWGAVKRIGIRASVIRTFDGAEVIVPNGMLIAEKVTNWTLSDRRRRLEVSVGVQYGTPAQRVIDLLVGVAEANSKVLSDPAPRAFFVNFGDSSLDFLLRAWIDGFDDGYPIRSELAVAIQQALEIAGIEVPFPQRDLHLVSVSPGVGMNPIGAGTSES
jgi:small-conductance mechanosensitive channel